jgi:putative transposase
VKHVQQVIGISERRACKALDQARSSQRLVSRKTERDQELIGRMRRLAEENPEYGYRMIWAALRQEGVEVNVKRVHRLWKQAGLKVVRAEPKRERPAAGENACSVVRAEYPNHVWTYDFMFDETSDGRKLKFLNVIDEYTRLCLRIEVGRSMTAKTVVRVLAELVQIHGEPGALRSDNGSEFTAQVVKNWLSAAGIPTLYIEPGSPWENGYAESFNSRFRSDFLDREIFRTLQEAQVLSEQRRLKHNHKRPHSSLGYKTPAQFAAEWSGEASAPTALRPHHSTIHPEEEAVAALNALP